MLITQKGRKYLKIILIRFDIWTEFGKVKSKLYFRCMLKF